MFSYLQPGYPEFSEGSTAARRTLSSLTSEAVETSALWRHRQALRTQRLQPASRARHGRRVTAHTHFSETQGERRGLALNACGELSPGSPLIGDERGVD
ncbi:hypothetical protein EYF80_019702 [Liparis tanakae]|uniref:Uncharacterized protein n=1 Tax=Liparis tanakae TaxID=230148 RepID=A0A4Z2HVZ5_9TELE|nr:hypothetical protein EYF80_019702 [Liparis tanakae]